MSKKLFEIDYFDLQNDKIEVETSKGDVIINRDKFEDWLKFNDRLEYCIDYVECGEHKQYAGVLSLDDYWESQPKGIIGDLYDYIAARTIKEPFYIDGALEKILTNV